MKISKNFFNFNENFNFFYRNMVLTEKNTNSKTIGENPQMSTKGKNGRFYKSNTSDEIGEARESFDKFKI